MTAMFHSACFAETCSGSTRARGVDPPAKRQGPVARPTYNVDPPLSDLTILVRVLQAAKTPLRNGGPFYGPNRGGPTFSNSRSKIKLRRNRVKNTPQGFTLLLRWDASCWHGCNSNNYTKAKTRNSASVRASPCPMAAGAASSEENPCSRSRRGDVRLFKSSEQAPIGLEQAPMCIRACPGEASEENPSSMTNRQILVRGSRR
jgi:hypothetical protein